MKMKYEPQQPLYDTQRAALEKLGGKPVAALLMAMRTGKSPTVMADFGALELEGRCNDLLVIAPGGVYRTWVRVIEEHGSNDLKGRLKVFVWETGNKTVKYRGQLKEFLAFNGPRCLLMNVEALSLTGEARATAIAFLSARKSMCVIDESTAIKSPTSKRSKFIVQELAPYADFRRILSGLPTPRSPLDLFAQFAFLDWRIIGHRSFFTFRNRYAVLKPQWFGGRRVDTIVGYQNQDELRGLIEPYSYRVEFRPRVPSTYSIREVALTPEQRKAYDEIRNFATTQLASESHVTATVVIAQLMKMHQVLCGHVKDELGVEHEIPEHRTGELLALLEDYSGKAIIWCSYDRDVRKVAAALEKEYGEGSVARFWGGNVSTRESEEFSFKSSSLCRFMVATPDAGRFGRTWDNADLVVFYSSRNDLDHREQAEARPLGVGKSRSVDYVDLIAPDTVETKILEALRNKWDLAARITGDGWRQWVI